MSTPVRLALYAAVLAVVFAGAALAGAAVDPGEQEDGAPAGHAEERGEAAAHGEAAGAHRAAASAPGLSLADDGLRLVVDRTRFPRSGAAKGLAFTIARADGTTVRDFAVEHEKRMHLIVVRRDLTGFRHLHPAMDADGTWRTAADLSRGGTYRVYADFVTGGTKRVLSTDVHVGGRFEPAALPQPARTARTAAGHEVTLDAPDPRAGAPAELRFTVRRGGAVVQPQPYLGARGHLVALRAGDLAYLHTHPEGDTTLFETTYPSPGPYRLFLQFKDGGRVHTAAFTQEATR